MQVAEKPGGKVCLSYIMACVPFLGGSMLQKFNDYVSPLSHKVFYYLYMLYVYGYIYVYIWFYANHFESIAIDPIDELTVCQTERHFEAHLHTQPLLIKSFLLI